MSKIIFTNTSTIQDLEQPVPASMTIPNWYKESDSYVDGVKRPDGKGNITATVKRCIPVFDAITSGYIIKSPTDVYVSNIDGVPYFEWIGIETIGFHPVIQAPNHPLKADNLISYSKWNSPWSIKTPKGYSCLFIQPMHRESVFTIMPGIVDTDKYTVAVNFPFVLNDPNFEGLIPAGTEIAQVIPFKRDFWTMELGNKLNEKEADRYAKRLTTKFFDRYKTMFWERKQYK